MRFFEHQRQARAQTMQLLLLFALTLLLLVVCVDWLQPFFDTVPISLGDCLFMLPFLFAPPIAMELVKLLR